MQRRAAAVSVAFFLVIGVVSFSLIATASTPQFSVENPEHTLQQADTFTVNGTEFNVTSIEAQASSGGGGGHGGGGGGSTLERSGTLNATGGPNEITVEDEANVTLAGETYFAYFPDNSTMVLTQEFDAYRAHQEATTEYETHKNGLWGVTILSGLVSVFMIGLAYLPSRY